MDKKIYHLKYHLEPCKLTREDMEKGGEYDGGCDAMVVISIVKDESGASSTMVFSYDGAEMRPLSDRELFNQWNAFGARLISGDIPNEWKNICIDAMNATRQKVLHVEYQQERL